MRHSFYGFLGSYFALISLTFIVLQLFNSEVFISASSSLNILIASSINSLTNIDAEFFVSRLPLSYIIFSLFISQVVGIALLSVSLWLCWHLFGNNAEKRYDIKQAFKLTSVISLLIETLLFLFFMYVIPAQVVDESLQKKIFTAMSFSINTFNNAGLSQLENFVSFNFFTHNYILQLGIIGGMVLGNLGMFVIYELFSPPKLRERFHNHTIDWSLITKISVFGTLAILTIFSTIQFLSITEDNFNEVKIIELVIASVYHVSSLRGFGFYYQGGATINDYSLIDLFITIFGSGPFSTGGGLTLLTMTCGFIFLWRNKSKNKHFDTIFSITKNLLFYCIIAFSIPTLLILVIDSDTKFSNILLDQFWLFFNNHLSITPSNWEIDLVKSFTLIAGRIGFIVACYMTLKQRNRNYS